MSTLEIWHGRSLFVLFAAAALALGSARPLAQGVVVLLAAISFTIGLFERGLKRHSPRLDLISVGLMVLTAFTFIQAVPLPPGLLRVLSPRAFEIHDAAWASFGIAHRGGWFPISLDPPATLLAGLRMLAITLTYLSVRHRLRSHGGRAVLGPLIASGALVAIVFLLHRLAGWNRVYDEYLPRYVGGGGIAVPAPFVNANHLAGALAFTATLAFGLALASVDRFRRLTLLAVGAVAGGSCLLTLSRGGIVALVASSLLLAALLAARRFSRAREAATAAKPSGAGDPDAATTPRRRFEIGWVVLGTALALGAGGYVAHEAIVQEFESGDASKLELPRDAWEMATDHAAVGIGRGAFVAAYAPYQTQSDAATVTHPENLPMQFVSEWGLPIGGLALLGILLVVGRAILRPPTRPYNAAAIAAVFGLLVQNLVDFGLELLGLALPLIAALAIVREVGAVGDSERVRIRGRDGFRLPGWLGLAGPAVVLIALALVFPRALRGDLEADSDRLRAAAGERVFRASVLDAARQAFARHPADYYLPFLAGLHVLHTSEGSPIRFWNQSLRLRPRFAPTHLAVAAYLARIPSARVQAMEEYGEAVRLRPDMLRTAASAVAGIVGAFPETEPFVRTTRLPAVDVWSVLADAYRSSGNRDAAFAADDAILREDPHDSGARLRRASAALAAGRHAEAIEHVRLADWRAFESPSAYLVVASALRATGSDRAATALLEAALPALRSPEIAVALAETYARAGEVDRAVESLSALESGARSQKDRTDAVVRRANFLIRWERPAEALAQVRRALGIDPSRLDLWNMAADLAEKIGDVPGSVWALRELARRKPGDEALRERLRRAETRATTGPFMGP